MTNDINWSQLDGYRMGTIPLIVPITLFNHYVRKYKQPYRV